MSFDRSLLSLQLSTPFAVINAVAELNEPLTMNESSSVSSLIVKSEIPTAEFWKLIPAMYGTVVIIR